MPRLVEPEQVQTLLLRSSRTEILVVGRRTRVEAVGFQRPVEGLHIHRRILEAEAGQPSSAELPFQVGEEVGHQTAMERPSELVLDQLGARQPGHQRRTDRKDWTLFFARFNALKKTRKDDFCFF